MFLWISELSGKNYSYLMYRQCLSNAILDVTWKTNKKGYCQDLSTFLTCSRLFSWGNLFVKNKMNNSFWPSLLFLADSVIMTNGNVSNRLFTLWFWINSLTVAYWIWKIWGAVVGSFLEPLGQTKVMHSHQREITWSLFWPLSILKNSFKL